MLVTQGVLNRLSLHLSCDWDKTSPSDVLENFISSITSTTPTSLKLNLMVNIISIAFIIAITRAYIHKHVSHWHSLLWYISHNTLVTVNLNSFDIISLSNNSCHCIETCFNLYKDLTSLHILFPCTRIINPFGLSCIKKTHIFLFVCSLLQLVLPCNSQ